MRLATRVARSRLQGFAALWCLLMAMVLVGVKLAGWAIPVLLLVVFSAVWAFGAAMLWWSPVFGGVGTTLYGILLAGALLSMHGGLALNVGLSAGFLVGSLLAAGVLVERWRSRAA
jgi:hypothetical protein